jgi:hypothetical protein
MIDLGSPTTATTATDVNDSGQVTGTIAYASAITTNHPVTWTSDLAQRLYDYVGEATSINDRADKTLRTWVEQQDGSERSWLVDRHGTFHDLPLGPIGAVLKINKRRRVIWNASDPVLGTRGYTCELDRLP